MDSARALRRELPGASRATAPNHHFRLKRLSLALAAGFSSLVLANPINPTVVAGSAAFQSTGNALTITNTNGTVIDWKGFSIGQGEITRFIQPNAASQVLNRVTGGVPSEIFGALQSNGRVFLINQNGIAFGPNAQIDVGGLVVSSLGLSNADFIAGRLTFTGQAGAGNIVNQGTIRTASGGMVALVAPNVENHGIIQAPNGDVILAAGKSANLVDLQRPEIQVEVNAAANQALNVGQLVGRSIGIYAGAIKHSGIANATTAALDEKGRVVFKAAGDTLVAGSISVRNEGGQGGRIEVLGNGVGVLAGATLDASGKTGGGAVLVGGDFQGKNPEVQNARQTFVASTARISADAIENGDGGKVVVWADGSTEYRGSISARGGAQGGDGGNVEVSGKDQLVFAGKVDTRAPQGRIGTLLLDPTDVDIVTGGTEDLEGTTNPDTNVNTYAFTESDGVSPSNIDPGTIVTLLDSSDVTIQATNNITVSNDINASGNTASKGLTLTANNAIFLNANITLKQGATSFLTLTSDADVSGAGTITVGGARVITVLDGAINFSGITHGPTGGGAESLTLNAGTGTVNMGAIYGAGALPDATGLTDVTITNAGTTNFNGAIAIAGALTQSNAATGTTTFANTVSVGSASLKGTAYAINNSFASGGTTSIANTGTLTKTATGNITSTGAFSTGLGDVNLAANITTTDSDLTIGGNLVLAEGATPTLSTGAGTAGNILISGSTDGTAGAAVETLTLQAGLGSVTFGASVGTGVADSLTAVTITNAAATSFNNTVNLAGALTQSNAATGTTTFANTVSVGSASLKGTAYAINNSFASGG
ncbi:MAG: filamentous hemagglutinin N-terminal domain-containing protein, partial [Sulfuritalea sp.]|nr:filamentous hemagglutinin N-terminal domain-containing protein [Sulfuritalea sp.]